MRDLGNVKATVVSIQVGSPQNYGAEGAENAHDLPWRTAFFKTPVSGPVYVGTTNLAGDAQADLKHHGGVDKAVLAYSAEHYPKWRRELQRPDFPHGAFGENLTILGLEEAGVCIGDVWRAGSVRFEVSQPRQPCWKLARRWRMHKLTAYVIANGRSGWYLRVLEPGPVEAGLPMALIERPNPHWSIARANHIMHHDKANLDATLALAAVPRLARSWVHELTERAEKLRVEAAPGLRRVVDAAQMRKRR